MEGVQNFNNIRENILLLICYDRSNVSPGKSYILDISEADDNDATFNDDHHHHFSII